MNFRISIASVAFMFVVSARAAGQSAPPDQDAPAVVDRALIYLALSQQSDGAIAPAGASRPERLQTTSAVLLAFLSAGHTPDEGRFGRVVARATNFLLVAEADAQTDVETSAHVAFALSQVLGVESDPFRLDRLRAQLPRYARHLLERQIPVSRTEIGGAWSLADGKPSLRLTALVMVALRALDSSGTEVPGNALGAASGYLMSCRHPSGAFSERPREGEPSRQATAAAIIAFTLDSELLPPELATAVSALSQLPNTAEQADWTTLYGAPCVANLPLRLRPPELASPQLPRQDQDGSFSAEQESPVARLKMTVSAILKLTSASRLVPGFRRSMPLTPNP